MSLRKRMPLSPATPGALFGAVTAGALIAQQVAGKAVRDALFLSRFPAASLPFVMAAAAGISLVALLWLSRAMARRAPAKLLPVLLAASAVGLVLEWGLGQVWSPGSAVLVYLHTTAFGPALISVFWSVVNERFDPNAAKRAVARIAAGGTVGGVLGALAAWRGASLVPLPHLLLFLAAVQVSCIGGALMMRPRRAQASGPAPAGRRGEIPPLAAFGLIRTTPMLRQLGLLVVLGAATSALLDYLFSARAAAAFPAGPELLSFFGVFWLVVSVVSLILQLTLAPVAMKKLGLAANIATLPGLTILGSALGLAAPGLVSVSILRGTEAAHRNTLFRSAYEVVYTPLNEGLKRSTKALIDVGFDRFGTVLGSIVAALAVALYARGTSPVILAVVVVLALATLPVAWRLHLSYVAALEQGLRDGARGLDLPWIDPGTAPSAIERTESIQRDRLIERVELLRPGGLGELSAAGASGGGPASEALRDPRPLLAAAGDLLSGDAGRVGRALDGWSGSSRPVVGYAILLLAHPRLHRDAVKALRRVAHLVTGELVDCLLDPSMDFMVRQRIPRALVASSSQRAADGLLAGIYDERFEVRYACGRALVELLTSNPSIAVASESVVKAILLEREKSAEGGEIAELELDPDDDDPDSLAQLLVRDRIGRSLEHVFALLSLHLDREPLRMAFRALHSADVRHRGTALEYLHTVFPSEIREAVWPLLGELQPLAEARPAVEVLADLVRVMSSSEAGAAAVVRAG